MIVHCYKCGAEIILGALATEEDRQCPTCKPEFDQRPLDERQLIYCCMDKECGLLHRFPRGSKIPERAPVGFVDGVAMCGHDTPLRVSSAMGELAYCIYCGVEVVLMRDFEKYDEMQWPLCKTCAAKAPKIGPWDHSDGAKYDYIIGLDEVGWGALAGPLTVGAAVVPRGWRWPGLRDSKDMTPLAREHMVAELSLRQAGRVFVHVETMLVREFEKLGAENALLETHRRAAVRMKEWVAHHFNEKDPLIIIDGKKPVPGVRCKAIVNADDVVPAVMVAAIFAKVRRDRYMLGLHQAFPEYGFDQNSGYGKGQAELVKKLGGTPVHRRNYNPLKTMLGGAPKRGPKQLNLFEET